MMVKNKGLIAILLILMVFFVGCGSGSKKKEEASKHVVNKLSYEEITNASDIKKLPESAKKRVDTLNVGINEPKGNFNPLLANSNYDSQVCSLIFEGLVGFDENDHVVPKVAKEWKVSNDNKTYTFEINQNIKFSDGSELSADDIAFTYTALCDPKYSGVYGNSLKYLKGYKDYILGTANSISGIKVNNKYEIEFNFDEIKASAFEDFTMGILEKKYYNFERGKLDSLNDKLLAPVGCGPYKLIEYKKGDSIKFERNANYWRGQPKISNIVMQINNLGSNSKGILNGNIDIYKVAATPDNINNIYKAGFLDLHMYDSNSYQYIGLNLRNDKFKDKKVRQALLYGLNRKAFIQGYYGEYGFEFNTPFSRCSWAYPNDINSYNYDENKANSLLDEAGWVKKDDGFRYNAKGEKFTIQWSTYNDNKYIEKLIPQIKSDWKKLGIEVNEKSMDLTTLVTNVFDKRDFEMYNMSWNLELDPDPSPLFSVSEDTPSGYNAVGWRNDESEKLIADGLKEVDENKRKSIYAQWGKLANEELPYLYLNQNKEVYAVSCRVKNLHLSPFTDWTTDIYKLELK